MAKEINDFSEATIRTLRDRAGQQCSLCGCSTSGGNSNPQKATIIGEAAHIKGSKPGSARYDALMLPKQRCDIVNAIWLCSNCHTEIDKDQGRYPVELLNQIKDEHEKSVLKKKQIFSSGGRGGNARVESGLAIGGMGGAGGPGAVGGNGGDAYVKGEGFAMGGEGGEAGQKNRGGRGGRSPLEILGISMENFKKEGRYIFDPLTGKFVPEKADKK